MNEEELMNDIWKNTHHFMMKLANGEKLDLIETKVYKELLKKYVESEKARKEAIDLINSINDWEVCSKYDCMYKDDVLDVLKILKYLKENRNE